MTTETKKTEAKKEVEKVVKRNLDCEQVITIQPKVTPKKVFHYKGMEDAKSLISFLGYCPQLTPDGNLKVKKFILTPNVYIFTDDLGNITQVLGEENLKDRYTVLVKK